MKNGFNGLASKVQNTLSTDTFGGHLFIFRGRRGYIISKRPVCRTPVEKSTTFTSAPQLILPPRR
ncbi:IS66 family insertion sequence element accessory protein TnpB [Pantoea agglomerans]|nr:IS66 family insertion sequence element accessory protein TnpB [Pantoea agglomerans]NEH20467.1 hypothetical protein [Pantoea agglomerans]NQS79461.1 hypothetical protein [Pantoea agglomerans]